MSTSRCSRPARLGVAGVALALAAAGAPRTASARAPASRVVVAPLEVQGEAPAGHTERLSAALDEGIQPSGARMLPANSAGAGDEPGCRTQSCIANLARDSKASHVMTMKVVVDGRDFRVEATLFDGRDGKPLLSAQQDCEICSVQEASAMVTSEAGALLARVDKLRRPASVRIDSEPSGATVRIDGQIVGTTPLSDDVTPGRHEIKVSKAGFATRSQQIDASTDVIEHVELQLHPLAGDRMRVAGIALVGVGAGLLVPGITLAALHHQPVNSRCSEADRDFNDACPYRFATLPYGATLIVLGAAGVIAGATMLAVAATRGQARAKTRARLHVVPGGIGVRL